MATRVSYERAVNKIRALGNVLHRPLRDVLDSGARVAAIQFARTSQPFGTGNDAKQKGEKAVTGDIYRVYAIPGNAWADISNTRARAAFWKSYKAGEIEVAQRILDDFGGRLRGVPMERFDGGAAHRSARSSSSGRVSISRPKMIVTDPRALERYVQKVKGDVGTGKAAWADVARQISGSIRGLRTEGDITANWITRKSGLGYGRVSRSGSDENPVITIQSRIPYASHILSGTALSEAKAIARRRMIENLQHAVKAETRNLRTAA